MPEKIVTTQMRRLSEELKRRGIIIELNYWDGHKHIDIFIKDARLSIEIDGLQHLTDSEQIRADFKRECYSCKDGVDTLHMPNELLKNHFEYIVNALVEVVRTRII